MVTNDSSQYLSRRERKKAATEKRLFDVAMDLFRKQGIDNTSVQQICDHADVAKGTFFNYFDTKEHLLLKCHDQFKESLLDHVQSMRFDSAREAVQAAFLYWSELLSKDPIIGKALLKAVIASDLLIQSDQRLSERLYNWIFDKITQDVESGRLKSDLNIEMFISILFNVLSATSTAFLTAKDPAPIKEQLRSRCDFLFETIKKS